MFIAKIGDEDFSDRTSHQNEELDLADILFYAFGEGQWKRRAADAGVFRRLAARARAAYPKAPTSTDA